MVMNNKISNPDELTPVEFHQGLYLKREDLFLPFNNNINGGKLRQCFKLVETIKNKYDGIISCCSIYSPQAPISAIVAKYFNLKCVIGYGGTNIERLNELEMPILAKDCNAELRILSKSGIHKILYTKAKEIAKKENLFVVDYGFNIIDYPDIMFSAISNQVKNLPNELDNLIITCGSGITTIGILLGLNKYNKNVKNIYLVSTAPNRRKLIDKTLFMYGLFIKYKIIDLFHEKKFKYEKGISEDIDGIRLHPNYEAKTFNWLKNNIDYKKEKTLLWIVGAKPTTKEGI